MKALEKKLLCDLRTLKGQVIAIAAVIACGLAVFVMAMTTLRSIENGRDTYYRDNQFADLFANAVRAPIIAANRIAKIDGVAAVNHRVVQSMTLNIEGVSEPATAQVVSLPTRADSGLNQLHLRTGRWPDPERRGEVVIGETFAEAHGILPGDKLAGTMRGRREALVVVGIALSPEFIIQVQPGSLFPDDRLFSVFWMARRQIEAAADMEGAFNNLTLKLTSNANPNEVIRRIDQILEPYGGTGAYDRSIQYSARFVDDEIVQLRTMGMIPPSIFLSVAAFLLNISLRRIMTLQREQISALKAFGYTNFEVGFHYAKMAGVIVLIGSLMGCLVGTWMANGMTEMYRKFYRFPSAVFSPAVEIYLIAFSMATIAGVIGVVGSVRDAVKLPPAEAMRPAAPPNYRKSILEHLRLQKYFSQPARMIIREIERRPVKAALTSLGIALACAILIVGNFGKDSIDYLIDFQFSKAERNDAFVSFVEATPSRALNELKSIKGVTQAEPFRNVQARLRSGARWKQLGITGINDGGELFRLLDVNSNEVQLQGQTLVLSSVLGELLDIKAGDTISVEILEGERATRELRVSGFVEDFAGTAAYMNMASLNRFLHEGPTISGAYLNLDSNFEQTAFEELRLRPGVAAVSFKKATIKSFRETIAENLLRMRAINIIFASVIAVGVVYSGARISFSERSRDLATLRVIGMTRREVSSILLGELAVLTIIGIPMGFIIGHSLCAIVIEALKTELYRIPLVLNPKTYGIAAIVILTASSISALVVQRKVHSLNMINALKLR